MKYQGILSGLFSSLILSACLTTNVGERVKLNEADENRLMSQCVEIGQFGDVQSYIYKVNLDTEEILKLSSKTNPSLELTRISVLSDEIAILVSKIKSLVRKEWTDSSLDFKAKWILGLKDFNIQEGAWSVKMSFDKLKVRTVIVNGREQDSLKEMVEFSQVGNNVTVELNRKASVLEACSLSQTVAVIVDVRYYADGLEQKGVGSPKSEVGYRTFKLVLAK